jgi:hypothetical protein
MIRTIRNALPWLLALSVAGVAQANNVSENGAWQLPSTGEKVNKAYLERLRLEQNAKAFGAPVYNTVVQRQYNCSVASTALGTTSTANAYGLTSNQAGHASNALGNSETSAINAASGGGNTLSGSQSNDGPINSDATGDVSVGVQGNPNQVLNNEQSNSGSQAASVDGAACNFAEGN